MAVPPGEGHLAGGLVAPVRAAVLAAGRGVRMGGETPKTLLPVDGGPPLLHYILQGLAKAPVDDLIVVTGHRAGEVQAFVEKEWAEKPLAFIRNMRYASWGNFHSVRVALDQSPGKDLLVVNCDVVVPPDTYERVVEHEGDLVLAVQRRKRLGQEDMRVQLAGDRVLRVSKHLRMPLSHGEYCGVSLLRTGAAHRAYMEIASSWEWSAETGRYYEDVYDAMVPLVDVRASDVGAGGYAEVDTPADLEAAIEVIRTHH